MKFKDIPQFPKAAYQVDVPWGYIEDHLDQLSQSGLNLDPDYQRLHVWTRKQQIAFVEYQLRGGEVGKNIIFNAPFWMQCKRTGSIELVDGKQRLEAVRAFIRDDFKVFGFKCSQFEDELPLLLALNFRVCSLHSRKEVLELYLNINAGGTPHTKEELDRVRKLLAKECR